MIRCRRRAVLPAVLAVAALVATVASAAAADRYELVLATRNQDKVSEIQHILKGKNITFLSLLDFPEMPDILAAFCNN